MQNFVDIPVQKMSQTLSTVRSHLVVLEFSSDHSECVVDEVVVDVDLQQSAAIYHLWDWLCRTVMSPLAV